MRIVHLIPQLRLGAGRYVVDLAAAQLHSRDCDGVHVLISKDAESPFASDRRLVEELTGAGVMVARTGDFFHREMSNLRDASHEIAAALPHADSWVAHAHTAMAAAVAHLAGASAVVGTCHGVAIGRPAAFDLQDALAWQLCSMVTSPSEHWAKRLRESFGLANPLVIRYGLDLSKYPASKPTVDGTSALRIVTVAELTPRKGIDVLLEAIATLWNSHPHVEWHVIGDGDSATALRAAAQDLDPNGRRLVFHGFVPWPYARLAEYAVFVLPSRSDNQPIAAIEAMLAGLPIVASDVGGLGELVRDGQCGWTVPPDDAQELAAAMRAAIDAGPAERARLGRQGEAFARDGFDIRVTVDRLRDLYERARVDRRPRP